MRGKNAFLSVLLLLGAVIFFSCAARGDDEPAAENPARPECEPAAALAQMQQDPDLAKQMMVRTVEGIIGRLRCNVDAKIMGQIRDDPTMAEELLKSNSPECYDKLKDLYTSKTDEDKSELEDVVGDAIEYRLKDMGCPGERDKIDELIAREYRNRRLSANYIGCVMALHQVLSAENEYKNRKGNYTTDIGELSAYISTTMDHTAADAEAGVSASCCSVPRCEPAKPGEAWTAAFGLELSEKHGVAVYGYPIGGPDCLLMITPEFDDPKDYQGCYDESEEDAKKNN